MLICFNPDQPSPCIRTINISGPRPSGSAAARQIRTRLRCGRSCPLAPLIRPARLRTSLLECRWSLPSPRCQSPRFPSKPRFPLKPLAAPSLHLVVPVRRAGRMSWEHQQRYTNTTSYQPHDFHSSQANPTAARGQSAPLLGDWRFLGKGPNERPSRRHLGLGNWRDRQWAREGTLGEMCCQPMKKTSAGGRHSSAARARIRTHPPQRLVAPLELRGARMRVLPPAHYSLPRTIHLTWRMTSIGRQTSTRRDELSANGRGQPGQRESESGLGRHSGLC